MSTLSREERLRRAFEKPDRLSADLPPDRSKPRKIPGSDSDSLDDLSPQFNEWFNARIWLDAKTVALRTPAKWSTTVTALYTDFCQWMSERDLAPVSGEQFRDLLRKLGSELATIDEQEFVMNVRLREDVEAQRRFSDASDGLPGPATAAVTVASDLPRDFPEPRKIPGAGKPEARYACAWDGQGRPSMPEGVRLIDFRPLVAPVRLSSGSVIVDTEKFIATTLVQLDHVLNNRPWLAGNWPPAELIIRLRAVGCYVVLEDTKRTLQ